MKPGDLKNLEKLSKFYIKILDILSFGLRMHTKFPHQSITQFSLRLKTARKAANLTQEQLGLAIGLDEFVASSRMNHYEKGRHWPNYDLVSKIAHALNLPSAYFYAKEDDVAQIILSYWRGVPSVKAEMLSLCQAGHQ